MDVPKIWKLFQSHVEYTNEEMAIVKSDPIKVKLVTETPEFVKRRVIAEVIESRGCRAKHYVGENSCEGLYGGTPLDPLSRRYTTKICVDRRWITVVVSRKFENL